MPGNASLFGILKQNLSAVRRVDAHNGETGDKSLAYPRFRTLKV